MVTVYAYLGLLALLFSLFGYFLHAFAYRKSNVRWPVEEIERLRAMLAENQKAEAASMERNAQSAEAGAPEGRWSALKQELDLLEQRVSDQEHRSVLPPHEAAPLDRTEPSQEKIRRETLDNILKSLDRIEAELGRLPLQAPDEVTSRK